MAMVLPKFGLGINFFSASFLNFFLSSAYMKKLICISLLIVLFSCKKQTAETCFKVKYINGVCATKIYQIQDAAFYNLGADNWANPFDGKIYNHVFVQTNYCQGFNLNADSTVNVKVADYYGGVIMDCITCLAVYPATPPDKAIAIVPCK